MEQRGSTGGLRRGRHRLRGVAAVTAAGAIICAVFLPAGLGTGSAGVAVQKVVGQVTSVSGSERLSVRADRDAKSIRLREGDRLRLGDTVVAGRGVEVTLELVRPASVSADAQLIFIRPPAGTTLELKITLSRRGTVTTVTIDG